MDNEDFIEEAQLLHLAISAWNIGCGLVEYLYDTKTAAYQVARLSRSGDMTDDRQVSVMFYTTEDTSKRAAAIIDFEYSDETESWHFAHQDAIHRLVEDLKRHHKLKQYTLERQGHAPDPFYAAMCLGLANRIFEYMWLNTPQDVEAANPCPEL